MDRTRRHYPDIRLSWRSLYRLAINTSQWTEGIDSLPAGLLSDTAVPGIIYGHSTFSAAAARVLELFTGRDKFGVAFAPLLVFHTSELRSISDLFNAEHLLRFILLTREHISHGQHNNVLSARIALSHI